MVDEAELETATENSSYVVRAGLEPDTFGFQGRRPNHSATQPPSFMRIWIPFSFSSAFVYSLCIQTVDEIIFHKRTRSNRFWLTQMGKQYRTILSTNSKRLLKKVRNGNLTLERFSVADPDFELRRGPGFNLLAQPAFLLSVISSFFTQNKGGPLLQAPPLDLQLLLVLEQ